MLLLNADRVVRVEELAEALWESGPPPSGPVAVQNYVMRLRKTLGDADREWIITEPGGYLIRVRAGELDVSRFAALLGTARTAARDGTWDQAAAHARAALELWRGEPLADVDCETLRTREAHRMAELRLQALEIRIDADLWLGRHAEVIAELQQLAQTHPLRERLHGLLMTALYRGGRQAEALAAYQQARQVLVAELGTEPGPELRELHQQMLTADPTLETARPTAGTPQPAVPRQLPTAARKFTGRAQELAELSRLLEQASQDGPGTVSISTIGGTAGAGKTALAVHWAHLVADRFPDGQLYVNLLGYDPGQPMPAAHALAGFLRSLGVPGPDIPPEEHERAARYRSLLAGRRMLIMLDNAGSIDQVRPLLPSAPGCAVLVTSRDALAGLVAWDGAVRLDLDVLPLPDAITLLRALIGPRVDSDPDATAELAAQCCRLPLALRVAAELAAARKAMPLANLTSELADIHTRLDLLDADGDPRTGVRAVFSWSYRHLNPDAARTFRLLSLHPGPDLEPYAAAALTGTTVPQARRALSVLARAHLIQPASPGRHGMHDLIRGYARELSAAVDGGQEQHAALTRMLDYYLRTAAVAMNTLFPAERHRRPRVPQPETPIPRLGDPPTAQGWLDAERAALVAAAGHADAHGWPTHVTRLSDTVARYLRNGGHLTDALTIFGHALGAARRTGDRSAEATALADIGDVNWYQSRFQYAACHHRQALALFRSAGNQVGEACALGNMGLDEMELGRFEQAARHYQDAFAIWRELGDRFGEARALGNLGVVRRRQGRYQEAAGYYRQALSLCREIGDREGEAITLGRIGLVDLRLGRYQDAAGYLQEALALLREVGDKSSQPEVLAYLGEAYLGLSCLEQAARAFEQALAIAQDIGDPGAEADALNGLGKVLLKSAPASAGQATEIT